MRELVRVMKEYETHWKNLNDDVWDIFGVALCTVAERISIKQTKNGNGKPVEIRWEKIKSPLEISTVSRINSSKKQN